MGTHSFYFIGFATYESVSSIESQLPMYESKLEGYLNQASSFLGVAEDDLELDVLKFIGPAISAVTSFVSSLVFILIFIIFLFPAYKIFMARLEKNLNKNKFKELKNTLNEVEKMIQHYLTIKVIMGILTAAICAIICYAFGVDFIFILSVVAFFFL